MEQISELFHEGNIKPGDLISKSAIEILSDKNLVENIERKWRLTRKGLAVAITYLSKYRRFKIWQRSRNVILDRCRLWFQRIWK